MGTLPGADAGGVTATIDVELVTLTLVAARPPKVTVALLWKFAPLIVTEVPPAVEPLAGEICVTVGAGFVIFFTVRKPIMFEWPEPQSETLQPQTKVPSCVAVMVICFVCPLFTLMPFSKYVSIRRPWAPVTAGSFAGTLRLMTSVSPACTAMADG